MELNPQITGDPFAVSGQSEHFSNRQHQIRGAAALTVALAHMWQVFLYPLDKESPIFAFLTGAAMWAVSTFFLLSGMLIAMSIRRRVAVGFDLKAYLWARNKRIFPPLLMATLITVACVGGIHAFGLYGAESYWLAGDQAASRDRASIDWRQVISTLTLTYKLIPQTESLLFNGPLWSLVYEFWYYVMAGLVAAALANRSWAAAVAAVALCCWMLFVSNAAVPFWALGAVWGLGFAAGWWWLQLASLKWHILVLPAIGCFLLAAVGAEEELPERLVSSYSGLGQHLFYLLISCVILVSVILYLRQDHVVGRVGTFFAWAGGFSYTLYLVHFPLQMFLLSVFRPVVLQFGVLGHLALAAGSTALVVFAADRLSLITERQYRQK